LPDKGIFALKGQNKISAGFLACPFRAAIYLNHLTQGVALGYGVFWLSAQ
jgi:hypothetical protein